jgi:hypothetical protein
MLVSHAQGPGIRINFTLTGPQKNCDIVTWEGTGSFGLN